jgi:hypothetical protein
MKHFIFLLIIITLTSSCSVQIASDFDRGIDFKQYKTYAWLQRSDSVHNYFYDNAIIEKNVKMYVNKEMKARGYTVDIQNPDILLEYHSTSQKKTYTVSNPIYNTQNSNYNPAFNNSMNYNYNNMNNNYYNNNYNNNNYNNNSYNNQVMNSGYNVNRNYAYNNTPYIIGYNTQQVAYNEGTLLIDVIDRKVNQMIWRGWSVDTLIDEEALEQELPGDIKRIFKKYPIPSLPAVKKKP